MKKIISIAVSLCFFNLVATDIYGAVVPVNVPSAVNNFSVANYSLLPADIGKIVQDMYVLGNKTVINIQDLHADEQTQKNIVSVLEFLVNNYNVQNVYFEGAMGNLDFGWLNSIKDEKLKKDIANKLLSEGKITGAEYFGFFNKKKNLAFKGLEEQKIYKENFNLLNKMYENRIPSEVKMKNIEILLKAVSKKIYNYKLNFLQDLVTDYNNKNISQGEYYSYLLDLLKKSSVLQQDYMFINKFLSLEKEFSSLNIKKLKSELEQINKEIKKFVTYEQYSKLQKMSANYPNEYYNELLNFIVMKNLENKYGEFMKFAGCLKQKDTIDVTALLQEEKLLTDNLYEDFSKTVVQKQLIFLLSYTNSLLLLFTNSLPSFEYEYVKNNFDKYCVLLENYVSNADITEIKHWYKVASKFYSNNEKRNLLFLESILKKKISKKDFVNDYVVRNEERKSFQEILQTTKQPIDIMVTGGYHSSGLKELMAKLNINYAVIMPNVYAANTANSEDKFYKDYLKQYSILANTYQKFIRSSVMNGTWEDPVKVIVGTFLDYSVLQELSANLKNPKAVAAVADVIQQHFMDILKSKGINMDAKVTNIETVNDKSFIITVLSEDQERIFYASQNVAGEIYDKRNIAEIEQEAENLTELKQQQPEKKSEMNKVLKKISRFLSLFFTFPLLSIIGIEDLEGGSKETPAQPKKSLTDKGGKITVTNGSTVEYTDTVIEENAQVSFDGKIKLDNVFVGKDNKLAVKVGANTSVTLRNIDMSEIGELDITIEDDGEYDVVAEDGIVKVYKVLRTDFSSFAKKRTELVSILEKGKLFLPNEADWEKQNSSPVIVFYKDSYSAWGKDEEREKRSQVLYKGSKVVYVDVSRFSSYDGSIYKERFIEFLKENGLSGKDVCLDFSLIDENKSKPFEQLTDIWTTETKSATFVSTSAPLYFFDPSSSSVTRDNKHFYMNEDGTFKRYPYKDRNWLKRTLQKFLPGFEDKTFVFVWPVESVKYTYYIPQNSNIGGTPEQRVSAFEPFKQFMDKARQYSTDGKDSIVFMPGYLITELAAYLNNPNIANEFVDITYGNSKEMNSYNVWYQTQNARDIEKIEVLKLGGLSIVMYPEGNRGHNEQAYLKTLMATYNFGKESFDGMLTQAGFPWKSSTVYVYEGQEMESLDMEAQLLKNPSIKTGKVSYVYENLKKVFIALYLNMNRFFKPIIPKFTKGNWISIEDAVRDTIDINEIKEFLLAKSKLGFDSIAAIPVNINVLDEKEYGQPVILEQDGKKIPVYTLKIDDSVVYLVGVENENMLWQDSVLRYIKDYIHEYKNNIISFNGVPQITSARVNALLTDSFLPVVLNSNAQINEQIQSLGYDDIVDVSDIVARIGNEQLKYPHVAGDMQEISEAVTVIKQLKRKSFFGSYRGEKSSYVGVKIASDEHIFNNEMEENEFIEILKGSDIDFVTVVIRDNDLGVHVLNRETTVKENLTKLSQSLHEANKKIVLEYTFRFIDEFFKSFTRSIYEDCKDMGLDGIKLDLADCSVEDIKKTIEDLKEIREALPKLSISIQVSDKAWEAYSDKFEEMKITRTVSSKEELLLAKHDLSSMQDVNYEISIYKNQQEYEQKVFALSTQRERLLDKDPESIPDVLKPLVELGEEKFADQIIDSRLENILQKVVLDDSIGTLILPVNMLYAQRLKNNENSNVIQAVSNLIRLFKEAKGMKERRKIAYEYGLSQKVNLTAQQEEEIAKILRGENKKVSAGTYVRKHFPYVFDYFVESRQTRIEISDSFLFGIYEANVIRKYKEGQFGKVLQFGIDRAVYRDTQEAADTRQALFYRALAQVYLYKDVQNIQDMFSMNEDEYTFYEGKNSKENLINKIITELKERGRIYQGMTVFQQGFPLLANDASGYMPDRGDTVYEARLVITSLLAAYNTQEIEPVLPEIVEDQLQIDDAFIDENVNTYMKDLLASA